MPLVVGVSLKPTKKIYYFSPADLELVQGDGVVVNTSKGREFGEIVSDPHDVPESELEAPLKTVVRKASQEDFERLSKNKARESEAFQVCLGRIRERELDMKLVDAVLDFDGGKLTCYFQAEERIDFRQLVKDLASRLKLRIEMRQIGVRDGAKMIGGYGPCGINLCCNQFLGDFDPVSIRMAKDQDLPLNPAKISGSCGRLMCCLKYEHEVYREFKQRVPRKGEILETPEGPAKVVDYSVPGEKLICQLESGLRRSFSTSELNAEPSQPEGGSQPKRRRRRGGRRPAKA